MHLSVNISMTADGKSNLPGADSLVRIGNDADLQRMKKLRRDMDALIVGSGTIIADNASLKVDKSSRRELNGVIYPLRIAIIGENIPSSKRKIFAHSIAGATFIACGEKSISGIEQKLPGIGIIACGKNFRVDMLTLTEKLETEFGVKKALCEGGPRIIGAFLKADLIDRYYVTVCPYLFGGEPKDTITPIIGQGMKNKEDRRFRLVEMESSGDWIFLAYDRTPN